MPRGQAAGEAAAEPIPRPVYGIQCMVRVQTGTRVTGRPDEFEQAEIAATVGALLRRLRVEHRLSLRRLERRSGVSRATISRIERGQRRPRDSTLGWLAWGIAGPDDSAALKHELCAAAGPSLLCDSRWSGRQHARRAFAALQGGLLPLPAWLGAGYAVAIYGPVMPGRAADVAAVQEAARRGAFEWPETAWSSDEAFWLAVALDEAPEYELAGIGRAMVAAGRARAVYARRLRLEALRAPAVRPARRRGLPPGVPETERARYAAAVALGTALAGLTALGSAGQDRLGLGAQELRPGRPGPPRRGVDSGLLQDSHSQAGQFPVDPAVAPCGVLPGQPEGQGLDGLAGGRPAGLAAHGPRRLAAPDDVAVPAHDGVRGDQQPQPMAAGFGYHAEQGREQGPVCPVQLRAARLPPLQDGEPVAQDQDLGGFPRLLAPGQPQPCGQPGGQQEQEPQAHDR